MKKFLRALLFLLVLGGVVFALLKFRLIPNPFEPRPLPSGSPAPETVQRDVLRVAVASRPEKLLMSSLKRLLEVEHLQLEVVEYNPDTVWLELGSQELDLVIVPIGEAVQGQGRFEAGRLLFFTGQSVGLDQLLAQPNVEKPKRVGVFRQAATEFLARQMLPEAAVVPAKSLREVEEWLTAGAVDAALVDTSSSPLDLDKKFKLLTSTSIENPMPTVAVLSRDFAENADGSAYAQRLKVLEAAAESWAGLVSYLDSQPELLKSTLKKEADEAGVELDRMLAGYRFLSPSSGRAALEQFHQAGFLKRTLDLLVLSGANNLRAPDWESGVELPPSLSGALTASAPQATPASPTPELTPSPTPSQTATPSEPSIDSSLPRIDPTHTYPDGTLPATWPEPLLSFKIAKVSDLAPALSGKQVAVDGETEVVLHEIGTGKITVPLTAPLTSPILFDGQNFVLASQDTVWAVNSQGKQVWQIEAKGIPQAAAQVLDGKLYFAVNDGEQSKVLCLDKVDGEVLWDIPLDSPPTTRPVLALGDSALVVIPTEKGELRALNGLNGQMIWTQTLSSPVYIEPAAGFGKVALVRANGSVTLLKSVDGRKDWEIDLGTSLIAPPTLTSRGVLVPSKDTYLYHLTHSKGEIGWKMRLSQPMSEPAVVVGSQVVQSDEGGSIHVLELTDGTLLQKLSLSGAWLSRVTVFEKTWSVLDDTGTCRAYRIP